MSGMSRAATRLLDVGIAVVVIGYAEFEVLSGTVSGPRWLLLLSGVLLGVPLVWRRTYPWPVLITVFGTFWLLYAGQVSALGYLASAVAGLVAMYSFESIVGTTSGWIGFVLGYATLLVTSRVDIPGSAGWLLILLGGSALAGRGIRSRRILIEQLHQTTQALQRSRSENARAAVAQERVRIAQELHDVIAHAVSVIVIQAGAAERVLDQNPDQAREPLRAVQKAGREALTELRRLLGVLRPDTDQPASLAPQPGIADVPALAQHLTEAGLTVTMVRNGQPRTLPTGVELVAYRIVQEALTNVLKHSRAKSASVHIDYGSDVLSLKVDNDETSDAALNVTESDGGHGLLGMRERVTAYGGELQAGRDPDGGYSVRVRLPIPTA
jgi:signal transduction histidine kinase